MKITEQIQCFNCGKSKEVLYRGGYAYKTKTRSGKTIYFCSYGCMRKYENQCKEGVKLYEDC